MSRIISIALEAHLQGEVLTLATCWRARLTNGTVYGFTDHTSDLEFMGNTYLASTGYTPTAVTTNSNLSVDNLDVEGYLDSEAISEGDIFAGLWDYAEIEIFQVNYKDLTQGFLGLRRGWLGQIKTGRSTFVAELRGLLQPLQQTIGELFTPGCRYKLGYARCQKDLTDFTFTASVDSVTSNREFSSAALDQADEYFDYGEFTWTSGLNAGLTMEVKTYTVGEVLLQLNMPYAIAASDEFIIIAGCKKTGRDGHCKIKFDNYPNFGGFEDVPGIDKMMKGPL